MILEEMIAQVTAAQIQTVLDACIKRCSELFPDYEINCFSIPKEGNRDTHIDNAIGMLQSLKNLK